MAYTVLKRRVVKLKVDEVVARTVLADSLLTARKTVGVDS